MSAWNFSSEEILELENCDTLTLLEMLRKRIP